MEALLPVLTAWIDDGPLLAEVLRAALAAEVTHIALEQPPYEQTTHILEVNVAGAEAPFVLLAEPVGFAKQGLFPLQVRPFDDDQRLRLVSALAAAMGPERLSSLPPPPSAELVARVSARPPADPLVGRSIAQGKFRIDALLGSGAAGRVYRAFHRDLQKIVAVKVLHPFYQADAGFAARFQGEALAASRIDHKNVLRILDFGQEPDGMLYIVMEFLEGRDLAQVIEAEGPLSLERVVDIGMQICAGLSVAHDAGIIHKDIKPENVILVPGRDDEGRETEIAKVCDFGIAETRAAGDAEGEALISGTPAYMSPEQWQVHELDPRTDIYALGVTLYEMATRFVPFTAESTETLIVQVLTQDAPPASLYNADLDVRLDAILAKCLARERTERYADARELRNALRTLTHEADADRRRARRREVLDASNLIPLEDPGAHFPDFFIALSSAVMRTGYYDKNHRDVAAAHARLAAATDVVLEHRGELSFARRDVGETIVFTVITAAGEVKELKKLLPASVYELYADKLGEVFVRRGLVSLAVADGIEEDELSDLAELLSGPEIPAEELRQRYLARRFQSVSILFVADLLGRKRRLPWQVDLCLSRLTRDLRALPIVRGMSSEEQTRLRIQLVGDVLRTLQKPEQVRVLLDNGDLVAAELSAQDDLAEVDIVPVVVEALTPRAALAVARLVIDDVEGAARPRDLGSTGAMAAVRGDPRALLNVFVSRFVRDRSTESDELLRVLHEKSLVVLAALPRDLQLLVRGEALATTLAADPEKVLAVFDPVSEVDAYEVRAALLAVAVRVLARRGQVPPIVAVLSRLRAHANDAARAPRVRQCAATAAQVGSEADVLAGVAAALLNGSMQIREPALRILAEAGVKAAEPLIEARLKVTAPDPSLRARFVGAYREVGAAGLSALTTHLGALADDADPLLVEDLLRAAPDVPDEEGGNVVARYVKHPSPMVRRAAATALASLAGWSGRPALLELFSGNDDGVRLGALAGLRRINAVDGDLIAKIDRVLGGLAPAGEELRAAAAATLADSRAEHRATALGILARVVRVQRKSFVGILKDAIAQPQDSTMVLLASARALVAIGGDKGREVVRERAASASGVLRQQLESLLTTPVAHPTGTMAAVRQGKGGGPT